MGRPSSIGINPFFKDQSERMLPFWPDNLSFTRLIAEVQENWDSRVQGYREGVVRVPIAPEGYKTRVVVLQDGDKISGEFKSRRGDGAKERPRKHTGVTRKLQDLPQAQLVEVVLYRIDVLAEGGEERTGSEWDIITILAHPTKESAPMSVGTLMSNHFGLEGGTATKMSPEAFQEALRESFIYWADKAIAEVEAPVLCGRIGVPPMTEKPPCECLRWCSTRTDVLMLTGHHETCPQSPGVLAASKLLIEKMVRGIEDWASQEDGIPDGLWDTYTHAKAVLGESTSLLGN